jgi:hypothetical protein
VAADQAPPALGDIDFQLKRGAFKIMVHDLEHT